MRAWKLEANPLCIQIQNTVQHLQMHWKVLTLNDICINFVIGFIYLYKVYYNFRIWFGLHVLMSSYAQTATDQNIYHGWL